VGIVAVKNGNLILSLNIGDLRADPLQLVRRAADLFVRAARR